MPCNSNQNTINVAIPPISPIGGFGLPFSPIQGPNLSFDLPADLLEDILGLTQKLGALFPSGVFKANPDFSMKTVLDFVANILSQLAPFLSLYNFIMAALNLFICIIEVLCAIPNPFAVAAKLKKLFANCLPPFIQLFPWLALIAMIIALLLLILALVEYIIATILAIVAALIKNLQVLADGLKLKDSQSTLAAAQKIASLLCFIQNILSIFVAIAAIISIIEALAAFAGGGICSDEDTDGCCAPSICPSFVKNTPDGVTVTNGSLIYYNDIKLNSATIFASLGIPGIENLLGNLPKPRDERWQLIDNAFLQAIYPISLIITPVFDPNGVLANSTGDGNIFWPDPLTFSSTDQLKKAPYTVDIRMRLDPNQFNAADIKGSRYIRIKDCIVVRKPYVGVLDQSNNIQFTNIGGTLNIEGGKVYEDDGITAYNINGQQATLNTFIHNNALTVSSGNALPIIDDAIKFDGIEFIWKPNAGALAGYNLVTVGCIPSLSIEKAVQNSIITAEGTASVLQKLPAGIMPDMLGAQACVQNALTDLRKDVSIVGAAKFQAATQSCLTTIQTQAQSIVCNAIIAAVSQFKSTIELDTDVQFTTRPIIASVTLKDPTGTVISGNIPASCIPTIISGLKGQVTLGKIDKFTYDGKQTFKAEITSEEVGVGELSVSFDGKIFNKVEAATVTTNSVISENLLPYTFVTGTSETQVRRDPSDVSNLEG